MPPGGVWSGGAAGPAEFDSGATRHDICGGDARAWPYVVLLIVRPGVRRLVDRAALDEACPVVAQRIFTPWKGLLFGMPPLGVRRRILPLSRSSRRALVFCAPF